MDRSTVTLQSGQYHETQLLQLYSEEVANRIKRKPLMVELFEMDSAGFVPSVNFCFRGAEIPNSYIYHQTP